MNGVLIDAEDGSPSGTGLKFTATGLSGAGDPRSIAHGLGRKAQGFLEVPAADIPTTAKVGLFATAHPSGVSSETHVTVTPTNAGTCFLFVF